VKWFAKGAKKDLPAARFRVPLKGGGIGRSTLRIDPQGLLTGSDSIAL
jgi:hypothetical protein